MDSGSIKGEKDIESTLLIGKEVGVSLKAFIS